MVINSPHTLIVVQLCLEDQKFIDLSCNKKIPGSFWYFSADMGYVDYSSLV